MSHEALFVGNFHLQANELCKLPSLCHELTFARYAPNAFREVMVREHVPLLYLFAERLE
jgi:hypothetical protein